MMTLEQIKQRLLPMNLKAVAAQCGVHYNALYRMMNGGTEPKYSTVQKVSAWLEEQNKDAQ